MKTIELEFDLVVIDREALTGRRAEDEAVDRLPDVVPREPTRRRCVECVVLEGRDQRQPDALRQGMRDWHCKCLLLGRRRSNKKPRRNRRGPDHDPDASTLMTRKDPRPR